MVAVGMLLLLSVVKGQGSENTTMEMTTREMMTRDNMTSAESTGTMAMHTMPTTVESKQTTQVCNFL